MEYQHFVRYPPQAVHFPGYVRWLSIRDRAESVVEDVQRIRSHPLVNPAIPIYGNIYYVRTGRLNEVTAATEAGRPRAT